MMSRTRDYSLISASRIRRDASALSGNTSDTSHQNVFQRAL
jgi:hypothetical protein